MSTGLQPACRQDMMRFFSHNSHHVLDLESFCAPYELLANLDEFAKSLVQEFMTAAVGSCFLILCHGRLY